MTDRIALFLPSLRGGGAERVMANLARGFCRMGLEVDLVLAKAEGPYLQLVPEQVRVIDLGARGVLSSLPGLVRYLRATRPAYLLSTHDHASVVAIWARSLSRVRCRLVVRLLTMVAAENSKSLKGRILLRLIRWFYPKADAVISLSEGAAQGLVAAVNYPRRRIKVIPNPVELPRDLEAAGDAFYQEWFAGSALPTVLAVGRLVEAKDYPTLLQAFARVRKRVPARLLILGEGPERARLETLVAELGLGQEVAMPGFKTNPYAYMARAKVLVLASRWEGFANVLLEALAVGTPVVATDCPSGPAEILDYGKYGQLVPVQDVEALARALEAALEAEADPAMLKARAKDFALDSIARQYYRILTGEDNNECN